jgi:hypothetical protein
MVQAEENEPPLDVPPLLKENQLLKMKLEKALTCINVYAIPVIQNFMQVDTGTKVIFVATLREILYCENSYPP